MQQDFMDYAQMGYFNFQWTYKLWTYKLSVDIQTISGFQNFFGIYKHSKRTFFRIYKHWIVEFLLDL